MSPRIFRRAVPDPDHVLAGTPPVVFCQTEADHRAALRSDEILARNTDSPTEASGLRDHLVERVHAFRPTDPRDRLHLVAALEQLHAEWDRSQLQQALQ